MIPYIENVYPILKLVQYIYSKIRQFVFIFPLVKYFRVYSVNDYDNSFKITFQRCDGYDKYATPCGKLCYINLLHACMTMLGTYPGEIE